MQPSDNCVQAAGDGWVSVHWLLQPGPWPAPGVRPRVTMASGGAAVGLMSAPHPHAGLVSLANILANILLTHSPGSGKICSCMIPAWYEITSLHKGSQWEKKCTLTFSMDFTTNGSVMTKNVRQNFFEWGLFEIWTMWFWDRALGDPQINSETP